MNSETMDRAQRFYAENGYMVLLGMPGLSPGDIFRDHPNLGPSVGGWGECTAWLVVGNATDAELERQFHFIYGSNAGLRCVGAEPGEGCYKLVAAD